MQVVILNKLTGKVARMATAEESAEYNKARRYHPFVLSNGETADDMHNEYLRRRITSEANLIPGVLYCAGQSVIQDDGEHYDMLGNLVYWTGSRTVYEDGEDYNGDWDFMIAQQPLKPNPAFIDEPA